MTCVRLLAFALSFCILALMLCQGRGQVQSSQQLVLHEYIWQRSKGSRLERF
jgi:hypothetical protein